VSSADEHWHDDFKEACRTTKLDRLGVPCRATFRPCQHPLAHLAAALTHTAFDAKRAAPPRGIEATHAGDRRHKRQRQFHRAREGRLLLAGSR